ncbi:uncharacterized protein LOC106770464 [Vigna radiata var. radiata]|uniref:Uncharacterized protein LOC106770464 n=1 Tax=Vigna radiata var. radiata TaxID=3916 RepID=A0A1S3V085_VIGRR|nr:uncharacterized protein LOC106770464 [Vigna radiata var. radiata]
MGHSCSSSTCNECGRKHLRSISSRGDGSWNRNDGSIICHCGESCVLRTAKTVKNRGKKFWGCPRYKVGGENGGCNYFRWCTDWGIEETVSCEVLEANVEIERDKRIASVQRALMGVQNWLKILVRVVFVMNIVIIAMLMGRA